MFPVGSEGLGRGGLRGMHGGVENGGGKYRGVDSIGGGKAAWRCLIR